MKSNQIKIKYSPLNESKDSIIVQGMSLTARSSSEVSYSVSCPSPFTIRLLYFPGIA